MAKNLSYSTQKTIFVFKKKISANFLMLKAVKDFDINGIYDALALGGSADFCSFSTLKASFAHNNAPLTELCLSSIPKYRIVTAIDLVPLYILEGISLPPELLVS
ncbi:MAG: hypothetical protein HAW67_03305 [Endozoicomonadaceae bacterium]|nr:hypothetical protein [Endozoicomonadaceae bacterium]